MRHPYVLSPRARWGVLAVAAVLAGCGMPRGMEVRTAIEPKYEDDDVRFRTTYFFRVFDYCHMPGQGAGEPAHIRTDSLYRFRMTGKANALFNDVVFESGTLKSYEIDPLGAAVVFDKANRRFRFQSRVETERDAACAKREEELNRLWRLYNEQKLPDGSELKTNLEARIVAALKDTACTPEIPGASAVAAAGSGGASPAQFAAQALRGAGRHLEQAARAIGPTSALTLKWDAVVGVPPAVTREIKIDLNNLHAQLNAAQTKLGGVEWNNDGALIGAGLDLTGILNAGTPVQYMHIAQSKVSPADLAKALTDALDALRRAGKAMNGIKPVSYASGIAEAAEAMNEAGAGFFTLLSALENLEAFVNPPGKGTTDAETEKNAKAYEDEKKKFRAGATALRKSFSAAAQSLQDAARQMALAATRPVVGCAPGEAMRRGFQVLGPEGFRTLDQDDRLILAMSSSAQPLIQQIKDISGRMLAEQTAPGDALLGLVQARLKVSQALQALDQAYGSAGEKIQLLDPDQDRGTLNAVTADSIAAEARKGAAP